MIHTPFRLEMLGAPRLLSQSGAPPGRAAHKKRIALLAVLAAARGRPVPRDRLIALLWPELGSEAARHNLSEALYVLRRELGEAALSGQGGDVTLDPAVVSSDAAEFQDALEAGEAERAAALYGGPLLDGFHLDDAPELERWVDGERDRLARACGRVLEDLARAAEAQGSRVRAVEWWRRLAAHDPFSSRTMLALVRALDAAGERPAALRAAESHAALLRHELDAAPDPDLAAFVARLRAEPPRDSPPPGPLPRATAAPGSGDARGEVSGAVQAGAVPVASGSARSDAPDVCAVSGSTVSGSPVSDAPDVSAASGSAGIDVHAVSAGLDAAGVPGEVLETPADRDASSIAAPSTGTPAAPASAAGAIAESSSVAAREPRPVPPSTGPGGRRRRAWGYRAAVAGALLGVVAGWLGLQGGGRPPRAMASGDGLDPRRVAVLYFDDLSAGGELRYLATGFTERLIHELGQVPALAVVSRGGVRPYRDGAVPLATLAARLGVGSIVEGAVQRAGDSVWITVRLVDAGTGNRLESVEVGGPARDLVRLERALAAEVAGALRRRLGREVRLRAAAAETRSGPALDLLLRAEQTRRDALEVLARDPLDAPDARRMLLAADSLLAAAEARDRRWARPTLARGWLDLARGDMASGPARRLLFLSAVHRAQTVAQRGGDAHAEAMELRGTAGFLLALSEDAAEQQARLNGAEHDLRAALAARPSLAGGWSTLSQLLRVRGRLGESDVAARRALAEDAYLDDAAEIRARLFYGALWAADYARARGECQGGRRQFPADWRFVECGLTLLRNDLSRPADPAAAWRLVADLERMDPPAAIRAQNRSYSPVFRRVAAAAVSARAGDADSARAVLARARGDVGADSALALSLDYDEAWVRQMLGDADGACRLVRRVAEHRPWLAPYIARDPLFCAGASAP